MRNSRTVDAVEPAAAPERGSGASGAAARERVARRDRVVDPGGEGEVADRHERLEPAPPAHAQLGRVVAQGRQLRVADRRGLEPFVTVSHFSLPTWVHDPIAVRDALAGRGRTSRAPAAQARRLARTASTVREFRKYAAYLAWKLGGRVTCWAPLNEPLVVAANGFVNVPGAFAGYFPPGAFSFSGGDPRGHEPRAGERGRLRRDPRARTAARGWAPCTTWSPSRPPTRRRRATGAAPAHADYLFNRAVPRTPW